MPLAAIGRVPNNRQDFQTSTPHHLDTTYFKHLNTNQLHKLHGISALWHNPCFNLHADTAYSQGSDGSVSTRQYQYIVKK